MMLRTVFLLLATGLLLGVSVATAGVKDSLAYQGRLLDASDKPVTGNYDVTFSFWSDSTGGTQLYSEVRTVPVSSGLFSICLGCNSPDAFFAAVVGAPDVFLQVQLGGQAPMSPRTRIRNSPGALVSARVLGDITTSPARVVVGDVNGDGYLDLSSPPEQSQMIVGHKRAGKAKYNNIVLRAMADSVTDYRDCDSDDDGLIDSRYSATLGHGGGGAGGSIRLEADVNGDGVPENFVGGDCDDTDAEFRIAHELTHVVQQRAGANSSSVRLTGDLDGDGVPDRTISTDCDDTDASIAIDEQGAHVAITTNPDSTIFDNVRYLADHKIVHRDLAARNILLSSSSRQGPTDTQTVEIRVDSGNGGTARLAIKTKGTSAKRCRAGGDCDDTDSRVYTDCDDDGDGIADASVFQISSSEGSSVMLDTKASGIGGLMGPRMSTNLTVGRTTQNTSFGQSIDLDNDGTPETSMSSSVQRKSGSIIYLDREGNEVLRSAVGVDSTKGTVSTAYDADGDGLADRTVSMDCSHEAAGISIDEPGVHVAMTNKGWDGTIKGNIQITDGTDRTVNFDGDGTGYVSQRFGIGTTDPTNPLKLASGALCTPGGVWTNASDANLKENFQPVNGQELLDRVEQLPISEWNYKNESDDVKHIGPTAQDFKAVFGVGVNDKTISTIDPSGIALAAIKELSKQNRELQEQNVELKRELDALKAAVAKLSSKK